MNLNIIGNGFDLYHGLPSSYYHFGCYLIDNDHEFYEEIGDRYNVRTMTPIGPPIGHDFAPYVENMFWSDFERHLGDVSEYSILETSEDDLGLECDDPVELEMYDHLAAKKIIKQFVNWVSDTLDLADNYNEIKSNLTPSNGLLALSQNEKYITFNYTHTLQNIYNIPDNIIHYVHGECTGSQDDELVVGHGNDERINEIKRTVNTLREEYDWKQSSMNRINEHRSLIDFLTLLRKDVTACVNECAWFYDSITDDVHNITIYGLSFGDVDIPYLIQLRNLWPNAAWKFSYYGKASISRINDVAENRLGLTTNQYSVFQFSNGVANTIQSNIISAIDLNQY